MQVSNSSQYNKNLSFGHVISVKVCKLELLPTDELIRAVVDPSRLTEITDKEIIKNVIVQFSKMLNLTYTDLKDKCQKGLLKYKNFVSNTLQEAVKFRRVLHTHSDYSVPKEKPKKGYSIVRNYVGSADYLLTGNEALAMYGKGRKIGIKYKENNLPQVSKAKKNYFERARELIDNLRLRLNKKLVICFTEENGKCKIVDVFFESAAKKAESVSSSVKKPAQRRLHRPKQLALL